jgi:pyridoxal phosphate enzyme (YggS family)
MTEKSMSLAEKIKEIQTRVVQAAKRSPFGNREVTIMGASKAQSINAIRSAAELGLLDMGENYAQELMAKAPLCADVGIRWHFIGQLQSNKIKHLMPYVSSIDSVDSLELAQKIDRLREADQRSRGPLPMMLQVNLGSERQKAGLPPAVLEDLFPQFVSMQSVKVVGIMSLPPLHKDPEKMRPYFKTQRELFERLKQKHPEPQIFRFLSMGMSNDFEVAIEEGSNLIRLGEALFGPRPKKEEK